MSVIVRRVCASPARTSSQAWEIIVSVLFSPDLPDLKAASGPAASSIADGIPATAPFVLVGAGPRVRVYCLYGDDAIEGGDANEAPVNLNTSSTDWTLWLPCDAEDLDWVTTSLKELDRVKPYDAAVGLSVEAESDAENSGRAEAGFRIDVDLFDQL